MTRPSMHRSGYEREKDVKLMWLEEWAKDIHASATVMSEICDNVDGLDGLFSLTSGIEQKAKELVEKIQAM